MVKRVIITEKEMRTKLKSNNGQKMRNYDFAKIFWDQNSWPKVLGAAEIKQTSLYADNVHQAWGTTRQHGCKP